MRDFAYGFLACSAIVLARDGQWDGVILMGVLAILNGLLWKRHPRKG